MACASSRVPLRSGCLRLPRAVARATSRSSCSNGSTLPAAVAMRHSAPRSRSCTEPRRTRTAGTATTQSARRRRTTRGSRTGPRSSATGASRRNLRSRRATATAGDLQRDGDQLLAAIPALLAGHAPAASLLHGDLWSGNAARLASGEPVIFDPAVYFGDREADLAMTELFGGFDADFYAAYARGVAARGGLSDTPDAVQPLSRAQPPQPVRRRLRRPGGGDDPAIAGASPLTHRRSPLLPAAPGSNSIRHAGVRTRRRRARPGGSRFR